MKKLQNPQLNDNNYAYNLKNDISVSAITAAIIAVIVSYTGPLVLIFHAANSAGYSTEILSSWIWAISIGAGITGLFLSYFLKIPVITAWSTPGAALLVSLLPSVSLNEAVGAYLIAAFIITLLGFSGIFNKIVHKLPKPIASAMLAGILFKFGIGIFISAAEQPLLVLAMFITYIIARRIISRYAVLCVLIAGFCLANFFGEINLAAIHVNIAKPIFIYPQFSWHALLNIALPLAVVTLSGQYIPGFAILKTSGYDNIPTKPIVGYTGLASCLLSVFGSHGFNLAAVTAAICTGKDANENVHKRYVSGIFNGILYIIAGIFGGTLASIFSAFPKQLTASLAGIALLGAISSGLSGAMSEDKTREASLITFLVTASDIRLFGLGAAFWGLALGLFSYVIINYKANTQKK